MKTLPSLLSCLALTASGFAQVSSGVPAGTAHTPVHHSAAAGAHAAGGCITTPPLSSKIPALPAGAPCAKALYTVTHRPDSTVDYVSPLLSPTVREGLDLHAVTYSLGYVDTIVGSGAPVLQGKYLSVKYTGYLVDGTKFDSSYDHPGADPINFPYGQHKVIAGWDTGFEGMKVGGKRRLFIPYELAYGEAGRPPVIPAKSELIFDIEVVSQGDTAPAPKPAAPAAGPAKANDAAKPAPVTGSAPATTAQPASKPATTPATQTAPPKP